MKIFLTLIVALAGHGHWARAQCGDIVPLAGGIQGYGGDGLPGSSAMFSSPMGVAVDPAGNIYIADYWNRRIRIIDAFGIVNTIAGDGTTADSGDGGLATTARFKSPCQVAVDNLGNIFVADQNSDRIRKIDSAGYITTVAGTGVGGFSGDGGPATSAQLDRPAGLFVDGPGNVYIADYYNYRIRKVDTLGNITTVAGNGVYGYSGDSGPATSAMLSLIKGVATDSAGNIYIADTDNDRVRIVDGLGTINTFAGTGVAGFSGDGGPANLAKLNSPNQLAFDTAGNLYIADTGNSCIRKVDILGNITTVAGTGGILGNSGDLGPATSALLGIPEGVAIDISGNVYIGDTGNDRIRKVIACATTPTATVSNTPYASVTLTQTHSPTSAISDTSTLTPASSTPTPIFSATTTQTPTPTLTPNSFATVTPNTFSRDPLEIESAVAVPNPGARFFAIKLSQPNDSMNIRIWSSNLACVLQISSSAPMAAGWTSLAIPSYFIESEANGIYFATFSVKSKKGDESKYGPIKLFLLR